MSRHLHCHADWLSKEVPSLVGQLIIPSAARTATVHITIEQWWHTRRHNGTAPVVWLTLPNELDEESAASLLHFTCHVDRELCFDTAEAWSLLQDRHGGREEELQLEGLFNPVILSALQGQGEEERSEDRGDSWIHVRHP